ncbi:hypothetical protein CJ030_MR7G014299 [Morella rubra]|uniref:Reverse transcriptase/retrotransposon-derived protein RNase H-like domain-containing protein n=1 Tax=Morella rubra TaxID=262757 RepID=A0A6A1V0E2_9ROSI|nr:hypothetical protein CJ030_MR7G014299 [Morella rubra]
MNPLLLSSQVPEEPLYLYLAISDEAMSTTLIRDDSGIQQPIYYVSKARSQTSVSRCRQATVGCHHFGKEIEIVLPGSPYSYYEKSTANLGKPGASKRLVK